MFFAQIVDFFAQKKMWCFLLKKKLVDFFWWKCDVFCSNSGANRIVFSITFSTTFAFGGKFWEPMLMQNGAKCGVVPPRPPPMKSRRQRSLAAIHWWGARGLRLQCDIEAHLGWGSPALHNNHMLFLTRLNNCGTRFSKCTKIAKS